MSGIRPNKEQFLELMNAPDKGPVVMCNLLKFKERGGSKEYGKYGDSVVQMVEARGGALRGECERTRQGSAYLA